VSPDGEEGFPGEVDLTVQFSLTENNEWELRYTATATKTTVLALTNHASDRPTFRLVSPTRTRTHSVPYCIRCIACGCG
jgi:galactose mutarotase-like enzyme